MRGCTAAGELDDAQFSKPLPWIGLYIAAASLVCTLGMGFDAFRGIRNRKLWFPSKYFTLNATTLTLLGITAKFPVDLNTSMPSHMDQLSKLSGTVFICTFLGNIMPSLGDMSGSDILSNVVALGILVITVVTNVGIQIGTGVIYVFLVEHAIIMFFMLVLLVMLVASALPVPTTKHLLNDKFDAKYGELDQGSSNMNNNNLTVARLKESINKFWLMAHTGSPQYVMGRSATCTASGAFCLFSALILIEAFVRSHISESMFCNSSGSSDYKWSTKLVFFVQAVAIVSGTIAPASRWFNAISFRSIENESCSCRDDEFTVEEYWVQRLNDWREAPLSFHISGKRRRKLIHKMKNSALVLLVGMQKAVIVLSKLVRLLTIWPLSILIKLKRFLSASIPSNSDDGSIRAEDLTSFVLCLEGEDDLVDLILRSGRRDTKKWILKGKKKKPTKLIEFINNKHSDFKDGFGLVGLFDSSEIPSLVRLEDEPPTSAEYEPPNCWALPIVTLASIALAISGNHKQLIRSLLEAVYEGFTYVRFIEKYLDGRGLVNMRDAADTVWVEVDIYNRWLDKDIGCLAPNRSTRLVVEDLQKIGRERVEKFWENEKKQEKIRNPIEWPADVLAANCMYRVTKTILQDDHQTIGSESYPFLPRADDNLFAWLQMAISDILRACLTNLPRAIHMECFCSPIEVREQRVRDAALRLGEAEDNILKILGNEELSYLYPEEKEYIDDWCKKMQNSHSLTSTSISS